MKTQEKYHLLSFTVLPPRHQDFTFEKLEACHLARGFRSIGYHYYITKDGVIYPGRP